MCRCLQKGLPFVALIPGFPGAAESVGVVSNGTYKNTVMGDGVEGFPRSSCEQSGAGGRHDSGSKQFSNMHGESEIEMGSRNQKQRNARAAHPKPDRNKATVRLLVY